MRQLHGHDLRCRKNNPWSVSVSVFDFARVRKGMFLTALKNYSVGYYLHSGY